MCITAKRRVDASVASKRVDEDAFESSQRTGFGASHSLPNSDIAQRVAERYVAALLVGKDCRASGRQAAR